VILGFPCGQFHNQEPGNNNEILNSLQYVRPGKGFIPKFPLFSKGNVNGANQQPIYTWLKSSCQVELEIMADVSLIAWTPCRSYDITWNFAKFLIDKKGNPFKRYHYLTDPLDLSPDISMLLSQ